MVSDCRGDRVSGELNLELDGPHRDHRDRPLRYPWIDFRGDGALPSFPPNVAYAEQVLEAAAFGVLSEVPPHLFPDERWRAALRGIE